MKLENVISYRSNVNVTFWDALAKSFEKEMLEYLEQRINIIIASCTIGWWNGMLYKVTNNTIHACIHIHLYSLFFYLADKVNLSNVAATKVYFNYHHQSVMYLSKMYVEISYFILQPLNNL